jgi:hypothetical protein
MAVILDMIELDVYTPINCQVRAMFRDSEPDCLY